jgi:hypothetical protein
MSPQGHTSTAYLGLTPSLLGHHAGVLGDLLPFGPSIAEHCVVAAGLNPAQALATDPLTPEQLAALHKALVALEEWFASLDTAAPVGYIMLQRPGGKKRQQALKQAAGAGGEGGEGGKEEAMLFSECNPLLLAQLASQPYQEFPTFDTALDEFFSKVGRLLRLGLRMLMQQLLLGSAAASASAASASAHSCGYDLTGCTATVA